MKQCVHTISELIQEEYNKELKATCEKYSNFSREMETIMLEVANSVTKVLLAEIDSFTTTMFTHPFVQPDYDRTHVYLKAIEDSSLKGNMKLVVRTKVKLTIANILALREQHFKEVVHFVPTMVFLHLIDNLPQEINDAFVEYSQDPETDLVYLMGESEVIARKRKQIQEKLESFEKAKEMIKECKEILSELAK